MRFKQKATYWSKSTSLDMYGNSSYGTPTTINVRWEDVQTMFIDEAGQQQISKSIIYIPSDVTINNGDYIYLGETTTTNPDDENNTFKVKAVAKTPNLNNRKTEVKLWV